MNVNFEYQNQLYEIDTMIARMPKKLQSQEKIIFRKIGAITKKWVKYFLHKSDVETRAKMIAPSNYDGSKPYVHIISDITYSVRKDAYGNLYVSVRGGKKTGFKWHFLNDGAFARDGKTWIPGTNFMEKALKKAEGEISSALNEMARKVMD